MTESETSNTSIRVSIIVEAYIPGCHIFLDRLDLKYTFQEYSDLQSLVNCLDVRDTLLYTTRTKVVLGCTCVGMHLGDCSYSHVEMPYFVQNPHLSIMKNM